MEELVFEVLEEETGGYSASARGIGIHTKGESIEDLKLQIREAIDCYFDEGEEHPRMVRLCFVKEELMPL